MAKGYFLSAHRSEADPIKKLLIICWQEMHWKI